MFLAVEQTLQVIIFPSQMTQWNSQMGSYILVQKHLLIRALTMSFLHP